MLYFSIFQPYQISFTCMGWQRWDAYHCAEKLWAWVPCITIRDPLNLCFNGEFINDQPLNTHIIYLQIPTNTSGLKAVVMEIKPLCLLLLLTKCWTWCQIALCLISKQLFVPKYVSSLCIQLKIFHCMYWTLGYCYSMYLTSSNFVNWWRGRGFYQGQS